ncbi:MAG: hypothetical protein HUK02_02170 [Bacteroidaceae bacterium]|nr:hypothetical protein [Bacteroidaceae bacterium]
MKLINKFTAIALASMALATGFTSCSDDFSTDQYNKDGVNILAFGPMPLTRGASMRVTGTHFEQVREVLFPEGNQKITEATTYIQGDFLRDGSEELTVTIPDRCVPGHFRLVTASGDTIVSKSLITFAEEVKGVVCTPTAVHAGDTITLSGEFVWNIAKVTFADNVNVAAENFVLNTRDKIQVVVPKAAQTGPLSYHDGNDAHDAVVCCEKLLVDAAALTSVSTTTPEFGQQITITGENLDLIETVEFPVVGAVEFTCNEAGTEITVTVPTTAVNGAITLTQYSGIELTTDALTLPLATYVSMEPRKDVKVGATVVITGTLLDRITKIILPSGDELTNYTKTATTITFVVPENMMDGNIVLVQHDNWSVKTERLSMLNDGPTTIIWRGDKALSWSGDGQIYLGSDGGKELIEAGAKPGDQLRVMFSPTADDWQVQIYDGHWESQLDEIQASNYDLAGNNNCYYITITEELLKVFTTAKGWGGILVVQGQSMHVVELALIQTNAEKVLSEKELVADNWKDQPYALSDGGAELKDAGAKPGQKVHFYITPIDAMWKLEIVEGHWGPTYASYCAVGADTEQGKFTEYDLDANGGKVSVTLTQAMLDAAYTSGGWGGVFVLNGDKVKCTKITLE